MIVTHTQNADGMRRIYLGGKGSIECWLTPDADGTGWTFHLDDAVAGNALSPEEKRAWAVHTLRKLADALAVPPQDLATVPFEAIAALHAADPFAGRRVATGKRRAIESGFQATAPHITRPRAEFRAEPHAERPRQR